MKVNLAPGPRIVMVDWDQPVEDGVFEIGEAEALAAPDPFKRQMLLERLEGLGAAFVRYHQALVAPADLGARAARG